MKSIAHPALYFLIFTAMANIAWATESYLPYAAAAHIEKAPLIEIRNAKRAFPGILSGGQPTNAQLKEAKTKGFKTIISLRPIQETQGSDEASTVNELGMNYINIPVRGAAGISQQNSQTLIQALADNSAYPVLIHCASGNRVGALFALDAALRKKL
ncbi:MAG: hypothetical protein KUG76_05865, partial [Gammaproteobacteria bacterium]|nr:hypothetical protein [Gammaproteobacteria bacterium]